MVFAMWPITFAAGYPILIHMFTAYEPRHRCYIPGCDPEIGQGIKINNSSVVMFQPIGFKIT